MKGKTKGVPKARKTLRKVITFLIILSFFFILSVYFFMKSRYPAPLLTYAAERATGMDVEFRDLTVGPWLRLGINDFKVASGKETLLSAARLELVITLKGLASGRVVSLRAARPVISLSALSSQASSSPSFSLSGGKPVAPGGGPLLAMPWFFKRLIIEDGLIRQGGAGSPVFIGPLNLRITARPGNKAGIHAKSYLPLLKTSASINADVDIRELGLNKGHLSLGLIRLEGMDAGGLSLIRGARGAVKVDLSLERSGAGLRAALKGVFKDVALPALPAVGTASGKLTASAALNSALTRADLRAGLFLKEPGAGRAAYRALLVKGAYDIEQKELKITKAVLGVPSLGSIYLIGTVHGLPNRPLKGEIRLRAERVSLDLLNEALFRPLSMEISGPAGEARLSGTAGIKGSAEKGLEWTTGFTFADSVRYGQYGLNLADNPLKVRSKGYYYPHDDRVEIGALRIGLGEAGPITLKGKVTKLFSGNPAMDLKIGGSVIDLTTAGSALSGPLLSNIALKGEMGIGLSIKGRLYSPLIRGRATLYNTTLTRGESVLRGIDGHLDFGYDNAGLYGKNLSVSLESMGLNGFLQWAGSAPKLLKTGLAIAFIRYDGRSIRVGRVRLKAKKAIFTRIGTKPSWEGPLPRLLDTGLMVRSVTYEKGLLRAENVRVKIVKASFTGLARRGVKGPGAWESPLPAFIGTGLSLASVTYDGKSIAANGISLKVNKARFIKAGASIFEERNITLSGAFTGDISKNTLKAPRLTFSAGLGKGLAAWSGGLGGLRGEVSGAVLDLAGPIRAGASVAVKGLNLKRLRAFIPGFAGLGPDAEVAGALETNLTVKIAQRSDRTDVKTKIALGLKDGAFASADGNLAGEGLRLKAEGDVDLSLPSMKARFSMKATARDFELLAGSFYGSFKDRPLELSLRGAYDAQKDELRVPALYLTLRPVGSMKMSAMVTALSTAPRFESVVGPIEISNRQLYELFLRDTLGESMPLLAALDLTGSTSLTMRAEGTFSELAVRGELQLKNAGISEKEGGEGGGAGLIVKGMDLTLPLELHYPGAGKIGGGARAFGSLKTSVISIGPISIPSLKASPAIVGNTLAFGEDIRIPLFGGTITLGDIVFKKLLSPGRELGLRMEIAGIDLKRASVALGLPPFGGSLSGAVPAIRLVGNDLTTDGEIKLKLFGGEVTLRNMAVGEVFSPVPSFKSSIEISEINLGALTSAFDFGGITGVLQGRIDNLVIVKGQPESFFMDIKTVKRPGISQRINTKALENVSILGTGAVASVLNKGIYRLFDEYRYSKMGFQGQLENDELLLLGIETEGDKGYIIKGAAFPPKVNVVSYTNRISFKEMMNRLGRVDLSATGEAVVK